MTPMVANIVTMWEDHRAVPVRLSSAPHVENRSGMTIRFTVRENHPDKEAFRASTQEADKNNPFGGAAAKGTRAL